MTYTARIEVQKSFCNGCLVSIKKELQEVEQIMNISLYPKHSLITFSFMKADKLSEVLNVLSKIGYPEKGERKNHLEDLESICCS